MILGEADGRLHELARGGFLWPLGVAFVVTALITPVVRRIAVRLDLHDRPDAGLKPHVRPIPILGGLGIYLGWIAALAVWWWSAPGGSAELPWIAAAGTVMMATGLIDDLRRLRPKTRLFIQAATAGLLLGGDVGRRPAMAIAPALQAVLPGWLSVDVVVLTLGAVFCVLALSGASNATNLIDGLDGLCAGVVAIAAAGFVLVSGLMAGESSANDPAAALRAALCAAVLGACLGFLVHNYNPATIFMGDSGSLLLGFNVAVLMILFANAETWKWFAASLVVFAFPILDTLLAIARRRLNRRPLFVGDRSHFYDQLRDRGFSVRKTVHLCYLLSAGFAGLAIVLLRLPPTARWSLLVMLPLGAALAARCLGLLRVDDAAERSRDPQV